MYFRLYNLYTRHGSYTFMIISHFMYVYFRLFTNVCFFKSMWIFLVNISHHKIPMKRLNNLQRATQSDHNSGVLARKLWYIRGQIE